MKSNLLKSIYKSVKHWYVPMIIGVLFILLGVYVLFTPIESYLTLSVFFSLSFLIAGIADSYFAISNREILENWGWTLASGVLSIVLGGVLLWQPAISIVVLPYYVAFAVLFKSIYAIGFSLELKGYKVLDWGNLMGIGILGVVLSVIMLVNPLLAGFTIVIWTGIALITYGILNINISLKLKKIKDLPKKVSSDLVNRFNELKEEVQESWSAVKEEISNRENK